MVPKESPFKCINDAAQIAQPGDEILVEPGIYREYVDPRNGGPGRCQDHLPQHPDAWRGDHRSGRGEELETVSGKCVGMQDR